MTHPPLGERCRLKKSPRPAQPSHEGRLRQSDGLAHLSPAHPGTPPPLNVVRVFEAGNFFKHANGGDSAGAATIRHATALILWLKSQTVAEEPNCRTNFQFRQESLRYLNDLKSTAIE